MDNTSQWRPMEIYWKKYFYFNKLSKKVQHCETYGQKRKKFYVGRFIPGYVLSFGTFCPLGRYVFGTFCPLGRFVPWNVLSLGTFCLWDFLYLGRFVLRTWCLRTICLGTFFPLGLFFLGRFVCAPVRIIAVPGTQSCSRPRPAGLSAVLDSVQLEQCTVLACSLPIRKYLVIWKFLYTNSLLCLSCEWTYMLLHQFSQLQIDQRPDKNHLQSSPM